VPALCVHRAPQGILAYTSGIGTDACSPSVRPPAHMALSPGASASITSPAAPLSARRYDLAEQAGFLCTRSNKPIRDTDPGAAIGRGGASRKISKNRAQKTAPALRTALALMRLRWYIKAFPPTVKNIR